MTRDEILTYLNEQIAQAKEDTTRLTAQEEPTEIVSLMRSIERHCRDFGTPFEKLWYQHRDDICTIEDVADKIFAMYQDGKIKEKDILPNINSYFIENLTRWFCLNEQLIEQEMVGVLPDGRANALTLHATWFLFQRLRHVGAITRIPDTALAKTVSNLTGYSAKQLRMIGTKFELRKGKDKLKNLLEKIITEIPT